MAEYSVVVSDLKAKAEELQSLNQQFFAEVENLEETEGALNGMWEGEARESFHTAFTNDVTQMHNFYNAVAQYVTALGNIIELYVNAENQNIEVAATRNF